MPCRHVGEQTEAEGERLHDFPDQLDGRHDHRHDDRAKTRQTGRNQDDGLEVALGPERPKPRRFDDDECDQRERAGDGEVAGRRRAPGEEAEQVAVQNEEEERLDEGDELLAAVADTRERHVIADEQDDRLDRGAEPARSLALSLPPRHLAAGEPDREEHEDGGECHEDDMLGRRHVDVGPRDVPRTRQVNVAERQLDHMAVRRVLEDDFADIGGGGLDHLRNLVSRYNSGNRTPRKPRAAGNGGSEARWVTDHTSNTPSARNRIPIPPSHRAMNCGLGARMPGRNKSTAHVCATTATPPPIAAALPPITATTTTRPKPRPSCRARGLTNPALPRLSPPYRSSLCSKSA